MPQVTIVQKQRNYTYFRRAVVVASALVVLVVAGWLLMVVVAWQKHNDVVKQQAQLEASGNTSAEGTLLSNYINSKPPQQYRYKILVRLGDLAYAEHQYAAAAGWYFQAYRLNSKDVHVVAQLGDVSGRIGDKLLAENYYRKAIALTPKSDYQQIGLYTDQITLLETRR